jgi:type I restriction enzyme S subunit
MQKDRNTKDDFQATELGAIPADWRFLEFQDVMTGFSSGATPYRGRPEYYKGDIKWITSGELNYNIITDTFEKITEEAVSNTNLKILPKGTFLIAITGLEAEGTRGSCGVTGVEATTNQSCMALFPKVTLDNGYLYHFYVWQGKTLALKYCQGTKQQSYTGKIARTLPIILPPTKSEQTAIATTLSDTDGLIESLEKQISKKQNIKLGAMQELLTGRKRLNGFVKEWEIKMLGEVALITMGQSPKSEFYNTNGIGLPLIQGNADIENRKTIIRFFTSEITKVGELGSIIMSVRAPVGEISKAGFKCCLGRGVCAINSKNDFLYHYLIYHEKSWGKLSTGSTFDSVNSAQIRSLPIKMPVDETEQIAIALFLNEMDLEIERLEQKLTKFRMIKRGMMITLLTGKIRLS